jgi:hypothetical protein
MKGLAAAYDELKYDFPLFCLYKRIKQEGMNKEEITDRLENRQRLIDLEGRVMPYNDFI